MKFKESEKLELKRSTAELKAALKDLCAFANTELGTISYRFEKTILKSDQSGFDESILRWFIDRAAATRNLPIYAGIGKMNRLMQEYHLPIPEYKEVAQSFVVVFKNRANPVDLSALNLNPRQLKAMAYLEIHKRMTTAEYSGLFSIAERTDRQDLRQLARLGLIVLQGYGNKNCYYAWQSGNL